MNENAPEQNEWQIDTHDPRRSILSWGTLKMIHKKAVNMRIPPTTNTGMRLGGGMRVAVLESLTGGRRATPDEIARYLALIHNATHIPTNESPISIVEGLIPPPTFVEEI